MIAKDALSTNARGGTELLKNKLSSLFSEKYGSQFQIFVSRVHEELDPNKIRIYWAHDLPGDPAADEALGGDNWKRFHSVVFVSHWQRQMYHLHYRNLPYSITCVIENAIEPFDYWSAQRPNDVVNIGYWSTPHRGLEILVPVFEQIIRPKYPNARLHVYSSFELYGWAERDKPYERIFDICRNSDAIEYYGAVDNSVIREDLMTKIHIMGYPSIWPETSCLCLIEALCSGVIPVHSSLAALPETSHGHSMMYDYTDDINQHALRFAQKLEEAIETVDQIQRFPGILDTYYMDDLNAKYSWEAAYDQWDDHFKSLLMQKWR